MSETGTEVVALAGLLSGALLLLCAAGGLVAWLERDVETGGE